MSEGKYLEGAEYVFDLERKAVRLEAVEGLALRLQDQLDEINRSQKRIRVMRFIEYTYKDIDAMTRDMSRWTLQSPHSRADMTFRSGTLQPEVIYEAEVSNGHAE